MKTFTTTMAALAVTISGTTISMAGAADNEVPIRKITLYRSGVGSFQHEGRIDGAWTVEMQFETEQINDILKSLVLMDLDGGRVGAVSYGSKEPLAKRLASFRIDISQDPTIAGLLRQVRGAAVSLETGQGAIRGTILGVEKRTVPLPGEKEGTIGESFVNLVTTGGIRSVSVSEVRSFTFVDDELNVELERALATLAEHHADRRKSVELNFEGNGRRRVVVSYVHAMPVWKTSYRLVLPESGEPTLQGWAIVENTTDSDWKNVELSLASGRPVGFVMDLYEPLFAPRPTVPVPMLAALAPQVYRTATNRGATTSGFALEMDDELELLGRGVAESSGLDNFGAGATLVPYLPASRATAADVGEQFMYTLDAPVTLDRQRSAMLPILSDEVEGRRVSIFNFDVNAEYPMRGVELTNDTGLHLMPGPIAVYDGPAYAGDAQIPHTSRSQSRLLSYAVDLDVTVDREMRQASEVTGVRIVDGVVEQSTKNVKMTTYAISNQDAQRDRVVLIEHVRDASYDLVEPTRAAETLTAMYRFEVDADAGDDASLTVREERILRQTFAVTSFDMGRIAALTRSGRMSAEVATALREAAKMQSTINGFERRAQELLSEYQEIKADQSRIRDNMRTVNRQSELYDRYSKKLGEQETRIEVIQTEREQLASQIRDQQARLLAFLRDLDVD
ncbi:MAG: hypothetical protein AAFX05_08925 [Planctomycetota bacterium]